MKCHKNLLDWEELFLFFVPFWKPFFLRTALFFRIRGGMAGQKVVALTVRTATGAFALSTPSSTTVSQLKDQIALHEGMDKSLQHVPGLDVLVGFEPQTSWSGVGLTTGSRLHRIQQL